jgi:death-on-curing protein
VHAGIPAEQLARMDRVLTLAQSALAAPFAGFGDVELFPLPSDKAAVYCSRIVRYHPLPDGNKRTAYDVMQEFVERNGETFSHPGADLMATAKVIEDLAASLLSEDDFRAWVADRLAQ